MRLAFVFAIFVVLTGCQSAPVDTTPILLSKTKMEARIVDEPYTSVVAMVDSYLGPSAVETAFGPMIGRYFLTDDFAVYRHLKVVQPYTPPAQSPSMVDQVLGSATPPPKPVTEQTFEQLTYFLVNPDGVITDYASGRIASSAVRCFRVDPSTELVDSCTDLGRRDGELRFFDSAVRTSSGASIDSWTTEQSQ